MSLSRSRPLAGAACTPLSRHSGCGSDAMATVLLSPRWRERRLKHHPRIGRIVKSIANPYQELPSVAIVVTTLRKTRAQRDADLNGQRGWTGSRGMCDRAGRVICPFADRPRMLPTVVIGNQHGYVRTIAVTSVL
jgi:hypothetical protein